VTVRADRTVRLGGVDVAHQRLCVVGQTLVQPGVLAAVHVVLQQVLVLVGERALVVARPRLQRVTAGVGLGVGGRVVAGAVQPVVGVDGHHVAVERLVEQRVVEPGDVGRALRGVRGVVVRVAHVADQDHHVVAVALVEVRVVAEDVPQRSAEADVDLLRSVALGRHREGLRLRGQDVAVVLCDHALDLRVGDLGQAGRVAAVALGEGGVGLHPDLDVVAHAAQHVVVRVDAVDVVQQQPRLGAADRGAGRRLGGSRHLALGGPGRLRVARGVAGAGGELLLLRPIQVDGPGVLAGTLELAGVLHLGRRRTGDRWGRSSFGGQADQAGGRQRDRSQTG